MKKIYILLAALAAMVSCKTEIPEILPSGEGFTFSISATQPGTKTLLNEVSEGWEPWWSENDSIYVTPATDFSKAFTFRSSDPAGRTATFSGTLKDVADGNVTIYCFRPKKYGRSETIFKFDIGPVQTVPTLDTFDPAADLMVADAAQLQVSETKPVDPLAVSFHRPLAIARLVAVDNTSGSELAGSITSAKLTVPNQTVSGRIRYDLVNNKIEGWESKVKYDYVTANYAGSDWLANGEKGAYVVVNPMTIPAGSEISLTVTTATGTFTRTATTSVAVPIAAGKVTTLKFKFEDSDIAPPAEPSNSWNFGDAEWQSLFATKGDKKTKLKATTFSHAGLYITTDDNWQYNDGYFQSAAPGSTSNNHFKFTASESGVVAVTESHTGSTALTEPRYVVVYNNGVEQKLEGSLVSTSPKTVKFNVGEGDVYIYSTGGGMRYSLITFTPGDSYDPEDPQEEEAAELEIPESQKPTVGDVPVDALYGFAQNVTGGEGGTVLHFDNGKALQTWLLARTKTEKKGDHTPVTIWLSGRFGPEDGRDFSDAHPWFDVKDVSNLSFLGTDSFVMDRIGIFCVRASNIVIRNINFQQPKANNGADAVSLQNCDGVWIDHCTFTSLNQTKDYEDGSTDITHGSKNVTVSWNHYIKTQKSCLVGHSNNQSGDVAITATFHHNWFDASASRHPRVRFGTAHVYNNLFDGCTTYGVGSAYGAKVLVEYNYFDAVQLPTDICTYPAKESGVSNLQGSVAGYLFAGEDVLVNRPEKSKDPYPLTNVKYKSYGGETLSTPLTYADFKPAYSYTVTAAENVPEVVKAGAGYGVLGWTEAPIPVNNGDITDFNGSDGDDDTPDDDDPGEGGEQGGARTHVVYYDSSSKLQNLTNNAAGSYFTATGKTDLGGDYGISEWTIGDYSSKKGIKMNSTGNVTFTTSSTLNSSVEFWFVRRKSGDTSARIQIVPDEGTAQVFDSPYDTIGDSGVLTLEKGTSYTIKQDNKEQALLLVIVTETE